MIAGGHPEGEEPHAEPRDTREWSDEERRRAGVPAGGTREDV